MNKSLPLLSLLLLNTTIVFGTTETTTETRYSLRNITEYTKKAWENKWVKVGAATVATASVYSLCVKFNLIALPSCFCAAKVAADAVKTEKDQKQKNIKTGTNNTVNNVVDTNKPSQQQKEETNSPSATTTTTEQDSSAVDTKETTAKTIENATSSDSAPKKQRKATNKESVEKPYVIKTPASQQAEDGVAYVQQKFEDIKPGLKSIFDAWKNRKDHNPEQGEF